MRYADRLILNEGDNLVTLNFFDGEEPVATIECPEAVLLEVQSYFQEQGEDPRIAREEERRGWN